MSNEFIEAEVVETLPPAQPTALATIEEPTGSNIAVESVFANLDGFKNAQRMCKALTSASLVPAHFQGDKNLGNAMIALDMANRMRMNPLHVMQNLYVIQGKPSWSSQFLISMFNHCGRFTSISYENCGAVTDDTWGCRAYATEKCTGQVVVGPWVTIGMAKAEGWASKQGSKWKTMPELMLKYRAAAFLIRTVAPELTMGLPVQEEAVDIVATERSEARKTTLNGLS